MGFLLPQFKRLRWFHLFVLIVTPIRVIVFVLHFMNDMDLGKLVRDLQIMLHDRTGISSQIGSREREGIKM